MEKDFNAKAQELYKKIENNDNIYNVDENIILKFINLRDSIPFNLYFQNSLERIEKKVYYQTQFYLREKKINSDFKISKEISNFYKISSQINTKSPLKNNKQNDKSINQEIFENDNEKEKSINSKNTQTKTIFSKINLLDIKTIENDIIIDDLLNEQYNFFEKLDNSKKSKNNRISYFNDCIGFTGRAFENFATKYIFELVNCLSFNRDFIFYSNIIPDVKIINKIFNKHGLSSIEEVQIDFCIYNLLMIDFINILLYLYYNIFEIDNLKFDHFSKIINIDELKKMKDDPNSKIIRLDIIGEAGVNIYNEDNKIQQMNKYELLFKNMEKLKDNHFEYSTLLKELKLEKDGNNKVFMFLTDSNFIKFYKNIYDENGKKRMTKFKKAINGIKTNSVIIYIKPNNNTTEDLIVEKMIFDYYSKEKIFSKEKIEFITKIINAKEKKLQESLISKKYMELSKKLDKIEKSKAFENILKNYLFNKKHLLLKKFIKEILQLKETIPQEIKFNIKELDSYDILQTRKNDKKKESSEKIDYNINVIYFIDEALGIFNNMEFNDKDIRFILINENKIKIKRKSEEKNSLSNNIMDYYKSFIEHNQEEVKKLKKKIKNSINIITFVTRCFNIKNDSELIDIFCNDINLNFLSYFILFQKEEISNENKILIKFHIKKHFHQKHVFITSIDNISEKIRNIIDNTEGINNKNYMIYSKIQNKYNLVIDLYNKYSENNLFVSKKENNKETDNLKDNYGRQKEILKMKIQQDIMFYLTLKVDNKNDFIKESLSLEYDDSDELNNILNDKEILISISKMFDESNDKLINNKIDLNFNSEDIKSIEREENISDKLGKDDNFIINKEKEKDNKSEIDIYVENNNKIKISIENKSLNQKDVFNLMSKEKIFIDQIVENIKSFIASLKIELYYKAFECILIKSFKNLFLKKVSEQIVEEEITHKSPKRRVNCCLFLIFPLILSILLFIIYKIIKRNY